MRYQNINPHVLAETKTGTRRYRSRNFHRFIRYWVHLAAATRKASTPSLSLYRWQKRNLLDINHLWVTHVTIGLSFESHLTGQKLFFSFLFCVLLHKALSYSFTLSFIGTTNLFSSFFFIVFTLLLGNKLFFFFFLSPFFVFLRLSPPVMLQTLFLLSFSNPH